MRWKKLREKKSRFGWLRLIRRTYEMPDETIHDFYIKDSGNCVVVFAMIKDNEVILVRQFRPGPEMTLTELIGGFIEPGEEAEATARRELLEETGYTGVFKFIGTIPTEAYNTMIRHIFIATDCRKVSEQDLDENEFIDVVKVPLKEFRNQLKDGRMTTTGEAYRALDYLDML
jgi:ADP-ribose pyrophosphatase